MLTLRFEPTTFCQKMLTLGFEPTTFCQKMLTLGFEPTTFLPENGVGIYQNLVFGQKLDFQLSSVLSSCRNERTVETALMTIFEANLRHHANLVFFREKQRSTILSYFSCKNTFLWSIKEEFTTICL